MRAQAQAAGQTYDPREEGFIDQKGKFYTRGQAWNRARFFGQIAKRVGGDGKELYSENLY